MIPVEFDAMEFGALRGLLGALNETEDYKNSPKLFQKSFDNLVEAIQLRLDEGERKAVESGYLRTARGRG